MTTILPRLEELLDRDLDYICGNLREEFGRIAGKNLLITGGAGFLGYYLVLAAMQWNKKADAASKIRVTVGQVGVRTRYRAESCQNASSSAIRITPLTRELRKNAWSLRIMRRPSGRP